MLFFTLHAKRSLFLVLGVVVDVGLPTKILLSVSVSASEFDECAVTELFNNVAFVMLKHLSCRIQNA
jgi:hypothetical protein